MTEGSSSDGGSGHDAGSAGSAAPRMAPGALIGGIYRLVGLLGVGGMGEVWEARHERTKGRVALKLLLPEMGRHEDVLRRFQREVEVTSGLNHPNIVRVSDADKLPDGRPYLVMEFLEGHDLTRFAGAPLPPAQVVEIVEQTAMGLQAAHRQSIVHRDLKPGNIFMVPLPGSSRVLIKILDFGISKALDGLSKLTQTRSVIGTPHYMAPEQATRGTASVDARADQFSLAAIAYELLTGHMAFEGDGMLNVIYKVVNETPPPFASWGVTVPPDVEAAVLRGLSKSPDARFESVMAFSEALKRSASARAASPARAAAPAPVKRDTLVLPAAAPNSTLRLSTGQIDAASGVDAGRGAEDAPLPMRAGLSRGWTIALAAGGAGLVAIVLVVALSRGSSRAPRGVPPSAIGPAVPSVATAAPPPAPRPVTTPAAVPPAAAPDVAPSAPAAARVAAPTKTTAAVAVDSAARATPAPSSKPKPSAKVAEHEGAPRVAKAPDHEAAPHAPKPPKRKALVRHGPINEDL